MIRLFLVLALASTAGATGLLVLVPDDSVQNGGLLNEDGEHLLNEDGAWLLNGDALLNEDDELLLDEDGDVLLKGD